MRINQRRAYLSNTTNLFGLVSSTETSYESVQGSFSFTYLARTCQLCIHFNAVPGFSSSQIISWNACKPELVYHPVREAGDNKNILPYVMMYLFTTVPHPHGHWQLQDLLGNHRITIGAANYFITKSNKWLVEKFRRKLSERQIVKYMILLANL